MVGYARPHLSAESLDRSSASLLRPDERAIEAVVARYQKVAPAVTRFARALSGNDKLRVVLGPRGGRLRQRGGLRSPPVPGRHQPGRSGHPRRDGTGLGTARGRAPRSRATSTRPSEEDAEPSEGGDLLSRLDVDGGPVAEVLFFSLEDARQELQGLVNYPGARSVLADIYQASLSGPSPRAAPLGQFALCCFLLTGDYSERESLERRVDRKGAAGDRRRHSPLCRSRQRRPRRGGGRPGPRPARDRQDPRTAQPRQGGGHRRPAADAPEEGRRSRRRGGRHGPASESRPSATPRAFAMCSAPPRLAPAYPIARAPPSWPVTPPPTSFSGSAKRPPSTCPTGMGGKLLVTPAPRAFAALRQRGPGRGRLGRQEMGSRAAARLRRALPALRRQPAAGAAFGIRPGRRLASCRPLHRRRPLRPHVRATGVADPSLLCGEPSGRRLRLDVATSHPGDQCARRGACRRPCWGR